MAHLLNDRLKFNRQNFRNLIKILLFPPNESEPAKNNLLWKKVKTEYTTNERNNIIFVQSTNQLDFFLACIGLNIHECKKLFSEPSDLFLDMLGMG